MDVSSWILAQSFTTKLLIGLSAGVIVYVLFRWFIYSANKSYHESPKKKTTRIERLRNLSGQ